MKRMDLFCKSSSSAAICSSLQDQRPLVRHSHTPLHLSDSHLHRRKTSPFLHAPCSSKLPINPTPYHEKSRKRSADINDLYSPHGSSSTYLFGDSSSPFIEWFSDSIKHASSAKINNPTRQSSINSDPASKSSSTRSHDQVVVLRVSLHCKGCEGKVRKHISKMEGVRSFSIDLATKKVTVVGDVTPLAVLASVSKVKNAQLWPLPSSPSSA